MRVLPDSQLGKNEILIAYHSSLCLLLDHGDLKISIDIACNDSPKYHYQAFNLSAWQSSSPFSGKVMAYHLNEGSCGKEVMLA